MILKRNLFLVYIALQFLVASITTCINAQELNIDQTISYINNKFQNYPLYQDGSVYAYSIKLEESGKLRIIENDKYKEEQTRIYTTSFFINKLNIIPSCLADNSVNDCMSEIYYNARNPEEMKNSLIFFSNSNEKCFYTKIIQSDHPQDQDYSSCFDLIMVQETIRESLCNAFLHLFTFVMSNSSYTFLDEESQRDPFATKPKTINKTSSDTLKKDNKTTEIPFERKADGTYVVHATLNDVLK